MGIDRYRCQYLSDSGKPESLNLKASIPQEILGLLQCALDHQRPSKAKPCRTKFSITRLSHISCRLRLEITWRDAQSLDEASSNKENDILAFLVDGKAPQSLSAWSPRDFYEAVHVPEKDDKSAEDLTVDGLESMLFPYQRRTVRWMLAREGADTRGEDLATEGPLRDGDHGFFPMQDHYGNPIIVNPWLGLVARHQSLLKDTAMAVRGVSETTHNLPA